MAIRISHVMRWLVALVTCTALLGSGQAAATIICDDAGQNCVNVTPSYVQRDPGPPPVKRAKVIGRALVSGHSGGSVSTTDASGDVDAPLGLAIRIVTNPRRPVDVSWTVDCSAGQSGSLSSGSYKSTSSAKHFLRLTVPDPDSCNVGALGVMTGAGSMRIELIATVLAPSKQRWLPIIGARKDLRQVSKAEQKTRPGLQRVFLDKDCARMGYLKVACGYVIGDVGHPESACRRTVTVSIARRGSKAKRVATTTGPCKPDKRMT